MIDVSGFGTGLILVSTSSFPMGFKVGQFADDQDPISARDVSPIGTELLYDGSLFAFDKSALLEVGISVIAGSDDDINLRIMLNTKKGSLRLIPDVIPDMTTMVVSLPDGGRIVLSQGSIVSGPVLDTIQSSGRRKSNTYTFHFGTFLGAQNIKQAISGVLQGGLEIL